MTGLSGLKGWTDADRMSWRPSRSVAGKCPTALVGERTTLMTGQCIARSIGLLIFLCWGVATLAQGVAVPQPLSVLPPDYEFGSVADETKRTAITSPCITDTDALWALWQAWDIPQDDFRMWDFSEKLVVVLTTSASASPLCSSVDGALKTKEQSTEVAPGFRYSLFTLRRADVTSVNGVPVPPMEPIERRPALTTITGSVTDRTLAKMPPTAASFLITDQDELTALWDDWQVPEAMPTVDFATQLVAVHAAQSSRMISNYWFAPATGDLQDKWMGTMDARPGFRYTIAVLSREGVKSFNGEPLQPPITVRVIATQQYPDSLQTTADTAVIKDVAVWKELFDKRMPPGTSLPEVNFGEHMALVVFGGACDGGQYPVITAVVQQEQRIHAIYSFSPMLPMIIPPDAQPKNPWTAVIVPKSDLPVTFTFITAP
jgi:hypothetical protein